MSTELEPLIKHKLPALADLLSDDMVIARIKQDDLNLILNTPVPQKWIKKHPVVNIKINGVSVPLPYISVKKVKFLLNRIYGSYTWEIKNVGQILNSIYVTGTITVINPITGEKQCQDGCGAAAIQMDSGATQGELSKIKANAIQIGLPAAESYALKNAAEKFGDIFGGNIYDLEQSEYQAVFNDKIRETLKPKEA